MSFSELKKYRREVYIITDENVADLWLSEISDNLNVCHKGVFVLRTGDSNKNFENLEKILYTMFSKGFSRENDRYSFRWRSGYRYSRICHFYI